jgi:hypothetical protein
VKSRAYENSPEKPLCELLTKIQGVTANLPSREGVIGKEVVVFSLTKPTAEFSNHPSID